MKESLLFIFVLISCTLFSQKTIVSGTVTDEETGEPIPFASVFFQSSKIGTETNLEGEFTIETYYASDSLIARASGFDPKVQFVRIDEAQTIQFKLGPVSITTEEVVVYAPSEKPSTTLYRKVVKNKPINNKEKLEAYEYETYSKIQIDLNNIGDKFEELQVVKKLSLIMDYLDTARGEKYLPLILSESLSDYYFQKQPRKKKEVISASKVSGIENLELNQFLGEMYQDINVYDNYIGIFDKSFISPISNIALSFYTFFLEDSSYIDNQWCYLMSFTPKRTGELTFEGEMWIHDTTYAIKNWTASVNKGVNINYVNSFYLEQTFEQVEPEVWMMVMDKLLVDLRITRKTKVLGLYGRKLNSRTNFIINKPRPPEFYRSNDNVEIADSANLRSEEYWEKHRHIPLNNQETKIEEMIDSLDRVPLFKTLKNLTFLATTGYYPIGKFEIGKITSLIGHNRVEGFRNQLYLRTSNDFSRRLQFWGRVAYGYKDKKVKYGGGIRFNITPKKRGMLDLFYDYDVVQLGLREDDEDLSGSIGSLFLTKPLTQLTFIEKFGGKLEKDLGKSWIVTAGALWKEVKPLGDTKFQVPIGLVGYRDAPQLRTFETSIKIRYGKNEEFISGAFDRISIGSRIPILSLEGTFGIKGVLGSEFEYQRLEFRMEHSPRLGILGTLNYEIYAGIYFGTAPYPFLKIHEGSQSYWLHSFAHNKMDYYEFISDRYVGAMFEHHFNGLILGHLPLMDKLKWRFVLSGRATWGEITTKQTAVMMLPANTRPFGHVPYVESALGIENILKVFRVDVIWRMTHLDSHVSPVGVRAKFSLRF